MVIIRLLLALCFFEGCANLPTLVKDEVVTPSKKEERLLVDVRSELKYSGHHISGSVSLRTESFILLKSSLNKLRNIDTDLDQTAERLSKKGITPERKVLILFDSESEIESKKWKWFFESAKFKSVDLQNIDEYRQQNPNRVPSEEPEAVPRWTLSDSVKSYILKHAESCFIEWNHKLCSSY